MRPEPTNTTRVGTFETMNWFTLPILIALMIAASACTGSTEASPTPTTTSTTLGTTGPRPTAAPTPEPSVVQPTVPTTAPEPPQTVTLFAPGDPLPAPPNPPEGLTLPTDPAAIRALEEQVAAEYEAIAWAIRMNAVEPGWLRCQPSSMSDLLDPYRSSYTEFRAAITGKERREPEQRTFQTPDEHFRVQVSLALYEFGIAEVTDCSYSDQIRVTDDGTERPWPTGTLSSWRMGLTSDGDWALARWALVRIVEDY